MTMTNGPSFKCSSTRTTTVRLSKESGAVPFLFLERQSNTKENATLQRLTTVKDNKKSLEITKTIFRR